MTKRIIVYIVIGTISILLQKFLDNFASLGSVAPQFVLLFVIYLSLREGQLFGTAGGFIAGLANDMLVTHFIGFTCLVGVLAGFISGFFYRESEVDLAGRTLNFAWISAVTLFLTELLALPIIAAGELNYFYVFLKFTLGTTVYTSVFAMIIVFVNGKKSRYV
ncbi:MAG: rod shape-determining protein MreD [Bacteroidetes bacterium]|nr:rod shape-determining protein MreD [Bacteroidota bacterium]